MTGVGSSAEIGMHLFSNLSPSECRVVRILLASMADAFMSVLLLSLLLRFAPTSTNGSKTTCAGAIHKPQKDEWKLSQHGGFS